MGLPPTPTATETAAVAGGIGGRNGDGRTEVDILEGLAGKGEGKLMWLVWPFQVRSLALALEKRGR